MVLGDAFPLEVRLAIVEGRLTPGAVVYLTMPFTPRPKDKYVIVGAVEGATILGIVINSEINAFISERAELLRCQVSLSAASETMLEHDSHAACHECKHLSVESVTEAIAEQMDRYRGRLTGSSCAQIVAAVKHARTMSRADQEKIINGLTPLIG